MSKDVYIHLDPSSEIRKASTKTIPENHSNKSQQESNTTELTLNKTCTIPDFDRFTDVFLPYAQYFKDTEGIEISEEVLHERLSAYRAVSYVWSTRLSTASKMIQEYLTLYRQLVSECNTSEEAAVPPYLRRLHHVMTSAPPTIHTAPNTSMAPTAGKPTRKRSRGGDSSEISKNGSTSKVSENGGNRKVTNDENTSEVSKKRGTGKVSKNRGNGKVSNNENTREVSNNGENRKVSKNWGNSEVPKNGNNNEVTKNGGTSEVSKNGGNHDVSKNGGTTKVSKNGGIRKVSKNEYSSEVTKNRSNSEVLKSGSNSDVPKKRSNSKVPKNVSNSKVPKNGSKSEVPNNGSNSEVPKNGSKSEVPNSGSNSDVPKNGSNSMVPKNGSKSEVTNNGRNSEVPKKGSKSEVPKNGSNSDVSKNRSNSKVPKNVSNGKVPKNGSKSEVPKNGSNSDVPKKRSNSKVPKNVSNSKVPKNGSKSEVPKNGSNSEVPKNVSNSKVPKNGSNSDVPKNRSNSKVPKNVSNTKVPKNGSNSKVPKNGSKSEVPNNGSNSEVPNKGSKSEVPKKRSNSKVPKNESNSKVPKNGSNSDVPKNRSNSKVPKDWSKSEVPNNGSNSEVPKNGSNSEVPKNGSKSEVTNKGSNSESKSRNEISKNSSEVSRGKSQLSRDGINMKVSRVDTRVRLSRARLQLASSLLTSLLQRSLRHPAASLYIESRVMFLRRTARHLKLDIQHFTNIWNTTNTFLKLKLRLCMKSGMMTSHLEPSHWRLLDFRVIHNDFNYNVLKWPSLASLTALETLVRLVARCPRTQDWGRIAQDFRLSGRVCSVVMLQYIWRQLLSLSHTHTYDVLQQVDNIRKEYGLRAVEIRPYVRCQKEDEDFGETELPSSHECKPNNNTYRNIQHLREQMRKFDEVAFDREPTDNTIDNTKTEDKYTKLHKNFSLNNNGQKLQRTPRKLNKNNKNNEDSVKLDKRVNRKGTKRKRNIDVEDEHIAKKIYKKDSEVHESDKRNKNKTLVESTSTCSNIAVAMETDKQQQPTSAPSTGCCNVAELKDGYSGNTEQGGCTVESVQNIPPQSSLSDQTQPIKPWKKSARGELGTSARTRYWYRLAALLLRGHIKKKTIEEPVSPVEKDPLKEWIRQKNCNKMYFSIPGIQKPNETTKKLDTNNKIKKKNNDSPKTNLVEQKTQEHSKKQSKKQKRTKISSNDSNQSSSEHDNRNSTHNEQTDKQTTKLEFIIQPPGNVPIEDKTPTVIITQNDHIVTTHEIDEMELITDKCDLFLNEELQLKSDIVVERDCAVVDYDADDCDSVHSDAIQSDRDYAVDLDTVYSDLEDCDAVDDDAVQSDEVQSDIIDLDAVYSDAVDYDTASTASTDIMVIDEEVISDDTDITSQQVTQLLPLLPLTYVDNQT